MGWFAAALAGTLDTVSDPREDHRWVADPIERLPPEAESVLDAELLELHRSLDAEVLVVTAPDAEVSLDRARALLEQWGVGDAVAHNGVVVLAGETRVQVARGDGLSEVLDDAWLSTTWRDRPVDVGQVVADVGERLRAHPDAARLGRGAPDPSRDVADTVWRRVLQSTAIRNLWVTGGLVGALAVSVSAFAGLVAWVRRREHLCPDCGVFMPMLSEADDDQHLTHGQVTEERVGSVDYQVHQCPKCGRTESFVVHRYRTEYTRCPQCDHRTRVVRRRTLVRAGPEQPGSDEIRETCAHCDYDVSYTRETPALDAATAAGSPTGGGGDR
ncbi:MAG: TPM domain-containing protein [Myxococcota bacterium]